MDTWLCAEALLYSIPQRIISMAYEPRYEKFEAKGPDGRELHVEFAKSGFLTLGDNPELYFFGVAGQEIVVGLSGRALKQAERERRFSREEKIDMAGLWLKRKIAAGAALDSQNLYLKDAELAEVIGELGINAGLPHAGARK
jgi:hypothetical protein